MNAMEASWIPLLDQARALGPDPQFDGLTEDDLEARLRDGASQIAAMTGRWLQVLAEFVIRGPWAHSGVRTPGQWLSWACGMSSSTAREHVRVALALRALPKIAARMCNGTLSYSKARAITRAATPETEDEFLRLADSAPASHVERIISLSRRSVAHREAWEAREDGHPEDVDVRDIERRQPDPDVVEWRIRMSPADAAAFEQRLDRLVDLAERDQDRDGDDRAAPSLDHHCTAEDASGDGQDGDVVAAGRAPIGVRRVEALQAALASAVAGERLDRSGADDHLVVVHVDNATLAKSVSASAEAGPAEGASAESLGAPRRGYVVTGRGRGMSLPRRVIARLACDARLRLAAVDGSGGAPGGHPADVGRESRDVPADLRRALLARDHHCRFPGCHATRHLHAHHVVHWAEGGPTDYVNLVMLCAFHHRFVHDRHWSMRPVDPASGRWTFHPPDTPTPLLPSLPLPGASAEAPGLPDPPEYALQPWWWDGHYDLDMTIAMISDYLDDNVPFEPFRENPDLSRPDWLDPAVAA